MQTQFYGAGDDNRGFRVLDKNGGVVRFRVNGAGSAIASADMRAPIFYDSANTAYYVDPAGTSNLSGITMDGTLTGVTGRFAKNQTAGNYTTAALWTESYGTTTTGIAFHISGIVGKFLEMRTDQILYWPGTMNADGDFRAPIFYDSNNTAYYVNPASTSYMSTIQGSQYSVGLTNPFDAADGSPWYGLGMNSSGVVQLAGYYGVRIRTASSILDLLSDYAQANNSFRAPIFYDSNNTGYYGDFAGTSVLFNLTISGTGNKYLQIQSTDGGEAMVRYLGASGPSWYVGKRTTSQLVDTASFHFYSESAGATVAGIDVSGNMLASGSMRAPIFYDLNNTAYYVDPATATNLAGTITQTGPGRTSIVGPSDYDTRLGSSDLWFWFKSIAGNGSSGYPGAIQFGRNDNVFSWPIVLNPRGGNVGVNSYSADYTLHVAGTGFASSDFRAPIFYDSNNTGYYIDPAGGTVLGGSLAVNGSRSLTYSASNGSLTMQGDAGGWGIGTYFLGSSGTSFGGFGALGGGNSFSYLWAGSAYNDAALYLYASPGNYAVSPGSFRAPIFYDSNNTGYYLDPNGTSNIIGLTVFNPISGFVTGCTFAEDSVNKDDITTRTDSGFYQSSSATTAEGWPVNSGSWQHMISCTHSNDGNYYAMQLGSTFFDQGLFYRATAGSGSTGWSRVALYDNDYSGTLRATIFYDVSNTGYYGDFASTGTSINVAGSIVAAGNVTAYSDIRVKDNVETIPSALDKLDHIRGVTYTRTDLDDKEQRYAGVIAQEIEAVLPEAVRDLGNIKAVDYNATIGLLIQAVKELTNKVKALEAKEQ